MRFPQVWDAAIGAEITRDVVVTVVVSREHLPHLELALATRAPR